MSAHRATAAHTERQTLAVAVEIPAHDARVTTALFTRTRLILIARSGGRCWICGRAEAETGHPPEAHHYPVERCLAPAVDWALFAAQARAGDYGPGPQGFDWAGFDPARWETYVDDMRHNGLLLCRPHHILAGTGIHELPHPLWLAQRFLKEGYRFDAAEVIHHEQMPTTT